MIYFKAATIPAPLLEVPAPLWGELVMHLREQGAGVRESGAFLLGNGKSSTRTISRFLPYEQLQADALRGDYVSLSAASFAKLWELCRRSGLSVVADVHTHRFGASQSQSDRTNPMVAVAGHIALIMPHFACDEVQPANVCMYVYQGNHRWTSYTGSDVEARLRLIPHGGQ